MDSSSSKWNWNQSDTLFSQHPLPQERLSMRLHTCTNNKKSLDQPGPKKKNKKQGSRLGSPARQLRRVILLDFHLMEARMDPRVSNAWGVIGVPRCTAVCSFKFLESLKSVAPPKGEHVATLDPLSAAFGSHWFLELFDLLGTAAFGNMTCLLLPIGCFSVLGVHQHIEF